LNVTESGNAGVESKTSLALVSQNVFDFFSADLVSVLVAGTLGDNDNCLALSERSML
jgi:hypothetical protein